jgi:hypothetical protein
MHETWMNSMFRLGPIHELTYVNPKSPPPQKISQIRNTSSPKHPGQEALNVDVLLQERWLQGGDEWQGGQKKPQQKHLAYTPGNRGVGASRPDLVSTKLSKLSHYYFEAVATF